MMTARLFCKTGQLAGASFEIKNEATIGKNPDNTIQLYPQLISGKHARIFFDQKANAYFLEDLNSRNGTWLDGMRVRGKERLDKLHVITFARTFNFFFQVLDPAPAPAMMEPPARKVEPQVQEPKREQSPVQQPPKPAQQVVPPPPPSEDRQKTVFDDGVMFAPNVLEEKSEQMPSVDDASRTKIGIEFSSVPSFVEPSKPPKGEAESQRKGAFVLVFESLKGKPQAFDLKEGTTIVGREPTCDIVIEDGSVSRKHAQFTLQGGRLTLKDLGSKNQTYVDDRRISSEVELTEGREMAFGLVKARVVRKPAG